MSEEGNGRITLAKVSVQIDHLQQSVDKLAQAVEKDHDELLDVKGRQREILTDIKEIQGIREDLTKKGITALIGAVVLILALVEVLLPHLQGG